MNLLRGLKILFYGLMVVTLKTKKTICACGSHVKPKVRNGQPSFTTLIVYTRSGSEEGHHYEYRWYNTLLFGLYFQTTFYPRCTNKKCQRGHFHGYTVVENAEYPAMTYLYEDDCMESKYLVTSRETCFTVEYLWEMTVDIMCFKASFSAMCEKFVLMHTGAIPLHDISDASDKKERLVIYDKRINEAWFLYSLIEQKGRFLVDGPVSRGENLHIALEIYHPLLREKFSQKWASHRCLKPGCGSVIVFDGGMKAQHRICSALKSGVKNFPATDSSIVVGCTKNPGTKEKYCPEHKHLQQPCISSNKLSSKSLNKLRATKTGKSKTIGNDTVYIIEGVLDSKTETDGRYFLIKWESYSVHTWFVIHKYYWKRRTFLKCL